MDLPHAVAIVVARPLPARCAPGQTGTASPMNPITATSMGEMATFTFTTPGLYPYFCVNHAASGVFGVVRVQ